MSTKYDFSGFSEAERMQIAAMLMDYREEKNGTDPRSRLEAVTKERDAARDEAAHWKRKYFALKNGGQT